MVLSEPVNRYPQIPEAEILCSGVFLWQKNGVALILNAISPFVVEL